MKSKFVQYELFLEIILVFLLAGLVFSFVSCSKSSDFELQEASSKPLKTPTVINWIGHWLNEGNKVDLVRDVAREFEFMNQEYFINLKFPEEIYENNNELDFIVNQLQKDEPDYDIIRLFGSYQEIGKRLNDPNWTKKYLVDFSTIPGFVECHKSFINTELYSGRNNGSFFGPHTEGQMAALYVNTEVAKKIGIEVKQFGMTFDDFLSYIKAAYEYNKTHNNVIPIFEYNWGKTNTIFNILFYSLINDKNEALSKQLTTNKLKAIEKCYSALEELSKYEPIEQNWMQRNWTTENNLILYDACLFFPNMTFMYGIWEKDSKEQMKKVMPCEFPVFQPSNIYIGGYLSNWAVLKKSPRKDAAVKLLMHWCRPDIAERWVRISKSPSGVKGNVTSTSFGYDPYENYTHTIEQKYSSLVMDEDKAFIVGESNLHIPLKVQEILTGQISAKDAFNDFKSQVALSSNSNIIASF